MKKGKKKNNTFKFKNFSERISDIKIDVYHHIGVQSHEIPENDKDTFFRECLEKWSELNCSLDFTALYRELKCYVQSFNQLVFHKETVVNILKKYLINPESLAAEPCLDLVAQLSRDLLQDFCPYFEDIFVLLVKLLKSQDTALIENTFVCVAHIFKFIWRYMIDDLVDAFRIFKCLFSSDQKRHIQIFAAESFAFLIRKSKNKERIFDFLFEQLSLDETLADGMGFLFFHTIKGVKNQFNFNVKDILQLSLKLFTKDIQKEQILSALKSMWLASLKHTTEEHGSVLFDSIYDAVENVTLQKNQLVLPFYTELLNDCVNFKEGKYIPDQMKLYQIVSTILSSCDVVDDSTTLSLSTLLTSFLFLSTSQISDKNLKSMLHAYIFHEQLNLQSKLQFCRSLFPWSKFNEIILDKVLEYISRCVLTNLKRKNFKHEKHMIFEFIVHLVCQNKNLFTHPFDYTSDVTLLAFPSIGKSKQTIVDTMIQELDVKLWDTHIEWLWIIVVSLLHTRTSNKDEEKISLRLIKVVNRGFELAAGSMTHQHLFTFAYVVKAVCKYTRDETLSSDAIFAKGMITLLRKFPSDENILRCFEVFCRKVKTVFIKESSKEVYETLKTNLHSPFHLVRLLTLMILKHVNISDNGEEMSCDLLQICLDAECVNVGLNTYRDRLMHLRKLSFNDSMDSPTVIYSDIATRYLIGNLFINLNVLWDPIIEVISTHAVESNSGFWDIWKEVLSCAANKCELTPKTIAYTSSNKNPTFEEYFGIVQSTHKHDRPDYLNFRMLLWKTMCNFPDLAERKSKDIVPLFFNFMIKEYSLHDEIMAETQDIRLENIISSDKDLEETGEEGNEKAKVGRQMKLKSLCAHIKLFTLFKNPRALSKETKLFQMYLDFLTHKDNEVQTLALGCLHTYKFQYLKPYAENMDKLMNDSTFRDELTLFSSNSELLKQEHRKELMPILIRLLYGKLQRKAGLGNSGKSSLATRRNVIMQFLSNCSHEEIKTFVDLIMKPFVKIQDLVITTHDGEMDISCIVPLRKQTGFLNMISNVVSRLTKMITPYFHSLFDTLLKIVWGCSICLTDQRDMIKGSIIGRLKETRHLGMTKLIEIFELLPDFDYQQHIEKIFTAAVWPQLKQMASDSTQNVTPLFRLISTWTKNNRYYPLLCVVDNAGNSPICCVYQMFNRTALSNVMEKEIMIISCNLLTGSNFVETGANGDELATNKSFSTDDRIGIQIIKPFVSDILKYLSAALVTKTKTLTFKSKQKIGHIIPAIQLSVLSSISEFVTDAEQCNVLIKILFPLLQYIAREDTQLHIITTIKNLLPYAQSNEEYLHLIPCLFSTFTARSPRQVLCQVYMCMAESSTEMSDVATMVDNLNSWDLKRLDEPDYERRLQAFRDVNALITSNSISCRQVLPILYNTLHFLMTTEDLSLRDASSSCIEKIVDLVKINMDEMFKELIVKILLPAVKLGLKNKKQATRMEFISLLSLIVKTFDRENCNDMKSLSSHDPETDFFENMRHIQVHRRIRALRQLSKLCEEHKLSVSNMFIYFIPMVSHVIFDSLSTTKDHNLLSETISTIGCIVKCLPWAKYSHILKNYLKVMRKDKKNQKTIIRVVVAILNNFHFNLSCLDKKKEQPNNQKKTAETNVMQESNNVAEKKGETEDGKKNYDNDNDDDGYDGDDDDGEDDEEMEETKEEGKAKMNSLSEEAAQRIHDVLQKKILPQVQSFLKKRSRIDSFHKMSHNKEEDEEEIMKVPMTLAMVKLLQHLPKATLHVHLPGLLLRVSQALRSHARDVRDTGRDTLKKICLSLGATYFPMVLKEMRSVLLRGYQLHILGYTLHSLLESMQEILVPFDLDGCVEAVMEVVVEELYGEVSEEKNVSGITGKLMEAKSHKSNETIEIVSKFISSGCIGKVITPLKNILESTQNHKTSRKIEESLRRVALGLQNNKGILIEDLLQFIHGIVFNTLPQMLNEQKGDISKSDDGNSARTYQREDIYLVPEAPARGGKLPGMSRLTNEHVLMEFGLQLLHTGLKRQKLSRSDGTHVKMLDPFVPILMSSMSSQYNKVIILTMRCVSFLIKFPLPSMKESVSTLAKQLFKILKKYAKAGAGKGDNFDLVMTSFKTMTVLIRDYEAMNVTNKQLHLLLSFVEEDIYDTSRQSTALPLLKAILSRKLVVSEIHDIMSKISELSVRDADDVTRLQCRQLMLQYLLDYPLGKKIVIHLNFYVTHLSYEDLVGRISTLEMLSSIVKNFPENLIVEYAGYFFIPLVMMLVNDDSTVCRKMAASVVKLILKTVDSKMKDELFDMVLTWLKQKNILLKQVSMQVAGMFIEVEGQASHRRIDQILPSIADVLKNGVEEDDIDEEEEEEMSSDKDNIGISGIKAADRLLYNALTCLGKLFMVPDLLMINKKYATLLVSIWESIQDLLLHSHAWVRLAASQLFSLYFAASAPDELIKSSESSSEQFLATNTKKKVKELCSLFFSQLKDEKLTAGIAEQATKNLVYLVKVVKLIDPYLLDETNRSAQKEEEEVKEDEEEEKTITVKTLVTRMNQLASYESSHAPKQSLKRTCVFRWIAALCLDLTEEQLLIHLPSLLRPVHREISTSSSEDSELFKLAQEVMDLIRGLVRKELFAEVYAVLQRKVSDVKESRKRKIAMEAVSNPQKHVIRKQKHNLAKREQRKRKLYEQKPSLKFKKIRSKPET